jgi:methylmalonyl-CoA mutase
MLPHELKLQGMFADVSYEQWKSEAEVDLKGIPFDRKMISRLYDGVELQPLYSAVDWPSAGDPSGFPGFAPFTRGTRPTGQSEAGWKIGREITAPDPTVANKIIHEEVNGGATLLELKLDAVGCLGLDADAAAAAGWHGHQGVMISSGGDLAAALAGVDPAITFISMHAGAAFMPAAAMLGAWLPKTDKDGRNIAFNADPLGTLMTQGMLPMPLAAALGQMADLVAWTAQHHPAASAVSVSGLPYHHAGASSLQDLAYMIGTGVEYLRAMVDAGVDRVTAVKQIRFHLAVGCQFFQAIAKLRALRCMWARAIQACGIAPSLASAMTLTVETSRRVLTQYDPWVNLLRNTACAFAGAVGGADAIVTLPMDDLLGASDALSRRLARNTQLILREECHLHRIADPAGGSWFLEKLTDQLAEKAWAELQAVEKNGGMLHAAASGWIAQQIAAVEKQRQKDVATVKIAVTGVSQHPDVFETGLNRPAYEPKELADLAITRLDAWRRQRSEEKAKTAQDALTTVAADGAASMAQAIGRAVQAGVTLGEVMKAIARDGQPIHATPLSVHPYAAAFEQLRAATDAHMQMSGGHRPQVFLANMGTPREFLARATYALNFFESGGFEPINTEGFADADSAAAAFAASRVPFVVICSTDSRYATEVEELAPKLKAAGARTVLLAGNAGANAEKYRQAGVDRFIFVKCDVLSTLRDLLVDAGVLPENSPQLPPESLGDHPCPTLPAWPTLPGTPVLS